MGIRYEIKQANILDLIKLFDISAILKKIVFGRYFAQFLQMTLETRINSEINSECATMIPAEMSQDNHGPMVKIGDLRRRPPAGRRYC